MLTVSVPTYLSEGGRYRGKIEAEQDLVKLQDLCKWVIQRTTERLQLPCLILTTSHPLFAARAQVVQGRFPSDREPQVKPGGVPMFNSERSMNIQSCERLESHHRDALGLQIGRLH